MSAAPAFSDQSYVSQRALIAQLDVGASFTYSRRLDQDAATRDEIEKVENQIENIARAAMRRAQMNTGNTYTGDLAMARTRSRDPVVIYIITRTA